MWGNCAVSITNLNRDTKDIWPTSKADASNHPKGTHNGQFVCRPGHYSVRISHLFRVFFDRFALISGLSDLLIKCFFCENHLLLAKDENNHNFFDFDCVFVQNMLFCYIIFHFFWRWNCWIPFLVIYPYLVQT